MWIIARLGQTKVSQPWIIAVGGKLWNFGVLLGMVGILSGNGTGFATAAWAMGVVVDVGATPAAAGAAFLAGAAALAAGVLVRVATGASGGLVPAF